MKYFLILIIATLSACSIPYTKNDVFAEKASLEVDELPHEKNSLEWWYFTGHLHDSTGKTYGVEYVFFHFTPTKLNDYMMVNVAISDLETKQFYYDYKIIKLKDWLIEGALPLDLLVKNQENDWTLKGQEGTYQLDASMQRHNYGLHLQTKPKKEVAMHSGTGYEDYGGLAKAGYYSYTRLTTKGNLVIDNKRVSVSGELWYDRQWNCGSVIKSKANWQWTSIQLHDTNDELMLYSVHDRKKDRSIFGGTYTSSNGKSMHLSNEDILFKPLEFWVSSTSGKEYPTTWQISIPKLGYELKLKAVFPEQELILKFPPLGTKLHYWEGACNVTGTKAGKSVTGDAYLEITKK